VDQPSFIRLITLLIDLMGQGHDLKERDILYIAQVYPLIDAETLAQFYQDRKPILHTTEGKPVVALTVSQYQYLEKLKNQPLVFGLGPAGTGKTFLAVMHGVALLKKGHIKRILLTRPAVEAGENLGFLPGDLREKIDPYLRPLYDALHQVLGVKTVEEYLAKNVIEIAPLAYMRGRTLDHAYVILDEAQNTTAGQMKLFLTRLGVDSKMVVNGDITQTDLPKNISSGLIHATEILGHIDDIGIHRFDRFDVIRHPLIQTILERYDA
jgi:phosphate starvation-inducible PhoH-like protein